MTDALSVIGGNAVFSSDRRYRWQLTRIWSLERMVRAWVLLNPSKANETENDPTVARCIQRDIGDGFGGTLVLNIFALCSTRPSELYKDIRPIGYANDRFIIDGAEHPRVGEIVCGWGNHGQLLSRGPSVLTMLRVSAVGKLRCLGLTQMNHPKHPLYQPYAHKPMPL